jgi:predicted secreted acid phosphatase
MKRSSFAQGQRAAIPKYRPGTKAWFQDRFGTDHEVIVGNFAYGYYEVEFSKNNIGYLTQEELDEHNDEEI